MQKKFIKFSISQDIIQSDSRFPIDFTDKEEIYINIDTIHSVQFDEKEIFILGRTAYVENLIDTSFTFNTNSMGEYHRILRELGINTVPTKDDAINSYQKLIKKTHEEKV